MGNGYNHHHHHLHERGFYSKNNSFLPILCRVSIRDVKLKELRRDQSSSFSSEDPSSPKVSCMGQVKRNTKLIAFPTPYRLTSSGTTAVVTSRNNASHGNLKYVKLKRFFSGRYLLSSNTSITAGGAAVGSSKGICRNGSKRSSKINHDDGGNSHVQKQQQQNVEVNLTELDPPLPVVKKVQPPPEVSLWKRRSGGMTLKNLQIEQIHHLPNNKLQPAPTV